MALAEFLAELDDLAAQATAAFASAADAAAVEAARIRFLGAKSGQLKAVQKGLGAVAKPDKPAAGARFNAVKEQIEAAFAAAQSRLAGQKAAAVASHFDPTVPGIRPRIGHRHPITQTIADLTDIMGRLGFTVADGPEVEDHWHNFEALNIPPEHPARDPLENFYLAAAAVSLPSPAGRGAGGEGQVIESQPEEDWSRLVAFSKEEEEREQAESTSPSPSVPLPAGEGRSPPLMLRSQTSTVQIRVMEQQRPPVRIISLGRVYRPDTADATHYPMFQQIEGLLVDRGVTMADLKSILRLFARSFFAADVHIRFRPSFFPFTEPSVEVDMSWQGGWMEMGGAGMVDPNVLQAVGYDPEEYSGFAFGLGVERVCARRHQITDIREFYKNDVRFLRQF